MSLGQIHQSTHFHVSSCGISGTEHINTVFENDIDAALAFTAIISDVSKDTPGRRVSIEMAVRAVQRGNGIYAGYPSMLLSVFPCSGGCASASWN